MRTGSRSSSDNIAGELIYRGPNVMLGYAEDAADLNQWSFDIGTGDRRFGRTHRGWPCIRIVGRKARFVKLFGLRIGLDEVESRLEAEGVTAMAAGSDDRIVLAVLSPARAEPVKDLLADWLKLPTTVFAVGSVESFALLPSGKRDYRALTASATASPTRRGQRKTRG